jgi:uncharacterized protein YsxB (DUF464 family)
MIDVQYRADLDLVIIGHAGQAPYGSDVVCAGASTLLYALAEYLESRRELFKSLEISLLSGLGHIMAQPTAGFEKEAHAAFLTTIAGYRHLAHAFPEYIRFTDCR